LRPIYTVSREDIYDYLRCPKIVAIKAYKALRTVPAKAPSQPRSLEPATIGRIGEMAVQLGLEGLPRLAAMQQIARKVPEVNLNQHLKATTLASLEGMERVRRSLVQECGEVAVIGKCEGRHPDLAGTVFPDFIAFTEKSENPIMIETKNTTEVKSSDRFQAEFYNGVAEKFGIYLLKERYERGAPVVSPKLIESKAETILIYPRLAKHFVVEDRFVPNRRTIKEVWRAKELGLKGFLPETDCGKDCAHWKLHVDLPQGNMEPAAPLPLIFSEGILGFDYDLDTNYQVTYGWKLLPSKVKDALLFGRLRGRNVSWVNRLKEWLVNVAGLNEEAAEITLDLNKLQSFHSSKPSIERLLKSMKSELKPWEQILKKRIKTSAPIILGKATSIYSLPTRSVKFVEDAWKRWQ